LQGLPGVGPERAERLLDRFGSVEAAISASSDELQSVDGIGVNIADKIRWVVSERVATHFSEQVCPEFRSFEAEPFETKMIKSDTNQELQA